MVAKHDTQELTRLTLGQAEAQFGAALERDRFALAPELPELRNEVTDFATKAEIAARRAVEEITWSLDAENNQTIWFIERDGSWIYLHHKVWDKDLEY